MIAGRDHLISILSNSRGWQTVLRTGFHTQLPKKPLATRLLQAATDAISSSKKSMRCSSALSKVVEGILQVLNDETLKPSLPFALPSGEALGIEVASDQ
jgi:hypothetical protein